MNITGLLNIINDALSKTRVALQQLPGILMLCTSSRRPGFSSIIVSSKIYADMKYAENENDEIVKKFVFNVVNRIKNNIQDDGVCFITIPPNQLMCQLTGGNAGGPLVLTGSNKNYVFVWGIIR